MQSNEYLSYLLAVPNKAKLAYLKVSGPGAYATHIVLGEFYDSFVELADELIEVYQGIHGIQELSIAAIEYKEPLEALDECRAYIQGGRYEACKESHLQNIVDELVALIDRTIYKLENLK